MFLVQINALSQSAQLDPVFPHHQPPSAYTRELFGVEYLFSQSGQSFCLTEDVVDSLIDEGFDEEEVATEHVDCDDDFTATLLIDHESDEGEEVCYRAYFCTFKYCYFESCMLTQEERSEAGPPKDDEAEQEVDDNLRFWTGFWRNPRLRQGGRAGKSSLVPQRAEHLQGVGQEHL